MKKPHGGKKRTPGGGLIKNRGTKQLAVLLAPDPQPVSGPVVRFYPEAPAAESARYLPRHDVCTAAPLSAPAQVTWACRWGLMFTPRRHRASLGPLEPHRRELDIEPARLSRCGA